MKKSNRSEFKLTIEELNLGRIKSGLPLLKNKRKTCCKCSNIFITHSKNICCSQCRRVNNTYFEYHGHYSDYSE